MRVILLISFNHTFNKWLDRLVVVKKKIFIVNLSF